MILILGGGDLASGVALRLHRSGLKVFITELSAPLAVRRAVSFAEAVYSGEILVEGVKGVRISGVEAAPHAWAAGNIPVMVDPEMRLLNKTAPRFTDQSAFVLIDGRMTKQAPRFALGLANLIVGLGPGFIAGDNCHAVVETNRGPRLGRVYWQGGAEQDTGIPEPVGGKREERVLRAPVAGVFSALARIGDRVEPGDAIAEVAGFPIKAPFKGVLRGLLHNNIIVHPGMKVGDLDGRDDPSLCWQVSEKALAVGGGVLEALLTRPDIRLNLWD
jgi:xanthine dehydrogenase accessory factor